MPSTGKKLAGTLASVAYVGERRRLPRFIFAERAKPRKKLMTKANEVTTQIKQAIDVVERKDHLHRPITSPGSQVAQKMSPEVLRQVTLAREALRQVPEIRADRVERVRAQIEAGTYQVDSMLIARKLLGLPAREDATPTLPE